jgi:hypothetical protein
VDTYTHHVFLSYRRLPDISNWVREVLGPKLQFNLGEALDGEEARVFWDTEDIAAGDLWWNRIEHALRGSCCLVPIWSPSYFRSAYCVAEWLTFRGRGAAAGLADSELVVPVAFNGVPSFPRGAKAVQWLDLSDFTYEGIQRTADPWIQLQTKLRNFAQQLALKIQGAPAFQANWPVILPEQVERRTLTGLTLDDFYPAVAPRIGRAILAAA